MMTIDGFFIFPPREPLCMSMEAQYARAETLLMVFMGRWPAVN